MSDYFYGKGSRPGYPDTATTATIASYYAAVAAHARKLSATTMPREKIRWAKLAVAALSIKDRAPC